MDILKMAKDAGMQVVLDARIGNAEYHSVHGTVAALVKFARALIEAQVRCEDLPAAPGDAEPRPCESAETEDR